MMKTGKAGLELIKRREGFVGHTYDDWDPKHRAARPGVKARGQYTIGYGHAGKYAVPGATMTEQEADVVLRTEDLPRYERAVQRAVTVPMNQNEFDALVSLCYNIGVAAFSGSTVVKRLSREDRSGAADAILWWNKDNGRILKGLVERRAEERSLFLTQPAAFE